MSTDDRTPHKPGAFNLFLMVGCAALSVLVVLLAIQNMRLKRELSTAGSGIPEDAIAAGETLDMLSIVDWDEVSRPLEFGQGEDRTLLLVFSSHCGACEQTLPIWDRIVTELAETPALRIVGVQTDAGGDDDGASGGMLTESLPFPVFPVDYGASPAMSRIPVVPTTLVVDARGVVEQAWFGVPDDDTVAEMRASLGL